MISSNVGRLWKITKGRDLDADEADIRSMTGYRSCKTLETMKKAMQAWKMMNRGKLADAVQGLCSILSLAFY